MIDPVTMFCIAWILNAGMPEGRLNVGDLIKDREKNIILEYNQKSVTIRKGI